MTTGSHSEPCINWPCAKGAGHAGPCGTSQPPSRIGPTEPDDTMVICPVCTSQFRAIPLDVQRVRAEIEHLRQQRDQLLEERDTLAEALRRAHKWGGLGTGWDSGVALQLIEWIEAGMRGELPPLPGYLSKLSQEESNG